MDAGSAFGFGYKNRKDCRPPVRNLREGPPVFPFGHATTGIDGGVYLLCFPSFPLLSPSPPFRSRAPSNQLGGRFGSAVSARFAVDRSNIVQINTIESGNETRPQVGCSDIPVTPCIVRTPLRLYVALKN